MIAVFASLSCVHAVPPTSETRLPVVLQLQGEAIHVTGSLWNLRIPTPCTSKRSMDEEQLPSQSSTLLAARFGEGWNLRLCLRLHKRLRIGSPRAHSCNGYSQATGSIWVNWQGKLLPPSSSLNWAFHTLGGKQLLAAATRWANGKAVAVEAAALRISETMKT